MSSSSRPTESGFHQNAQKAFAFLFKYGFSFVVPTRYPDERFQVWYRKGDFFVIVFGESWGSITTVKIEHTSGVELSVFQLVPKDKRPVYSKKKWKHLGQLEMMDLDARDLETYGQDFLSGDYDRFFNLARPLPKYKKPILN